MLEIVYARVSSCFNNFGTKGISIMIIGEQQLKVELFPRFISSFGSSYLREAVKAMEE